MKCKLIGFTIIIHAFTECEDAHIREFDRFRDHSGSVDEKVYEHKDITHMVDFITIAKTYQPPDH